MDDARYLVDTEEFDMSHLADLIYAHKLFHSQCIEHRQRYEQFLDRQTDPAAVIIVLDRGESTHDWLALSIWQLLFARRSLGDAQYLLGL